MKKIVWKEEIPMSPKFTKKLPRGSRILSVQTQRGVPCMWFQFEEKYVATKDLRVFAFVGTGHPEEVPDNAQFIDTFQVEGGALVFHLFEL